MPNTEDKRTAVFKNAAQNRRKKASESKVNRACIENHQKAGTYFTLAAKYQHLVARFIDEGNREKACKIAQISIGYTNLGIVCQKQSAMTYAVNHEK